MAYPLCLRIEDRPIPVQLRIVFQLQGLAADKNLSWSDKPAQCLLVIIQKCLIAIIRCIAGHNQKHRKHILITAWRFGIIGQVLKDQSFIKRPERCCHFTKIIRRPDDQTIRLPDCVKHRSQTIPADAMTFVLFSLASETGDASCISFQLEKIEFFYLCSG